MIIQHSVDCFPNIQTSFHLHQIKYDICSDYTTILYSRLPLNTAEPDLNDKWLHLTAFLFFFVTL